MTDDADEGGRFLEKLEKFLNQGEITRAEVLKRLRKVQEREEDKPTKTKSESTPQAYISDPDSFYRLVLIGVFLIGVGAVWWQWSQLSRLAQILSTLGSGCVIFLIGMIVDSVSEGRKVSRWFYGLSGIVLPIGLLVTYQTYDFGILSSTVITQTSGLLFVLYLSCAIYLRRSILFSLAILFGTVLFFGLSDSILTGLGISPDLSTYLYRGFVVSFVWLFAGFLFDRSAETYLSGFLLGVGSLGVLFTALYLGREVYVGNFYWELSFPLIVLVVVILGVIYKNRLSVLGGSVFLLAFLAKISFKYFRVEMGLPVALILLGFGTLSIASVTYLLYARLKTKNK